MALHCDGSCRQEKASMIKRKHGAVDQEVEMITLEHWKVLVGALEDGKWNSPAYIHNNIRSSGLC